LGRASHPSLAPRRPDSLKLARAIGRGQIVLLSSHFERYIYSLNEELVGVLNENEIPSERLPELFRLQHAAGPVDDLARTGSERRGKKLQEFASNEAWLWRVGSTGIVDHERMLAWMKAPHASDLVRYFRMWGIDDVFSAITRNATTRSALWLGIQGLVDLRNNIAHGDFVAQATQQDVRRYMISVRQFCSRVDRRVAQEVARQYGLAKPW
jgi:hypothetical protein